VAAVFLVILLVELVAEVNLQVVESNLAGVCLWECKKRLQWKPRRRRLEEGEKFLQSVA